MPSTPEGGPRTYAISVGDADCAHDGLEQLASDGGANRYYRCPSCDAVLVREGLLQSEGSDADLGSVDPRFDDLMDDLDHYHQRQPTSLLGRATAAVRRLLR